MFEDFNKMVEELASIETLKNEFISNVSHEIKTPLSVIQSYATALQNDSLTAEMRRDYTETIMSASHRLTGLVTNILKLNKLENQGIQVTAEEYDLSRQLCDCVLNYESFWDAKGVAIVVDVEERVLVRADESMLALVWNNLMSNAIKFTEPGGTVTIRQSTAGATVVVAIADTGCGMSEKTIKHMYDKFFQGDTSHSGEGNGLGLTMVRRAIDRVGGTLSVESTLGKGTTFTVTLRRCGPKGDSTFPMVPKI